MNYAIRLRRATTGQVRLREETTAGQFGGLLSSVFGLQSSVSFYTADANGNIGQLLDASDPTDILAHYEYSPFGETIVAVGDLAKANPFRFSTKYHEDESGLVYYGYRYYKPKLGRWVNRDPIGERGGLNVYGFVKNSSASYIDPDGHSVITALAGWIIQESLMPSLPVPNPQGTCGSVDITPMLNAVLSQIEEAYNNIDDVCCKKSHCKVLYAFGGGAEGAWDINLLALAGNPGTWPPAWGGDRMGGGDDLCRRTVIYQGQCVSANAANYAMWGKINSLCGKSQTAAKQAAFVRKRVLYGGDIAHESKAWTQFGYTGQLPAEGIYANCEVPDGDTLTVSTSGWHWTAHSSAPVGCDTLGPGSISE